MLPYLSYKREGLVLPAEGLGQKGLCSIPVPPYSTQASDVLSLNLSVLPREMGWHSRTLRPRRRWPCFITKAAPGLMQAGLHIPSPPGLGPGGREALRALPPQTASSACSASSRREGVGGQGYRHSGNAPSTGQTTFSIFKIASGPSLWASDNSVGRGRMKPDFLEPPGPRSKAWDPRSSGVTGFSNLCGGALL